MSLLGGWTSHRATVVFVALLIGTSSLVARAQQVAHRDGQGVVPIYDGYEPNGDGTVTLWFGYINRNYEEVLDIPVGPDNTFSGPQADRGQPTHFETRRKKSVFSVVVPESEAPSVRWSLTIRGRTEVATATILPSSVISRRRGTVNSLAGVPPNTPPVVKISLDKQTVSASDTLVANVSATDDGQPKRTATGASIKPGMTVTWYKYRGPGTVSFKSDGSRLTNGGSLATKVTFSQPGEYTLLAIVDDGSMSFGEYCCWTNTYVKVSVQGKP
jgi:plastocyanin